MKMILLFSITVLSFGLLSAQNGERKFIDGDYPSMTFYSPEISVRNIADVDSIFVVSRLPNYLEDIDLDMALDSLLNENSVFSVLNYVFYKGDTLISRQDLSKGNSNTLLYKTTDGRRISSMVEISDNGDEWVIQEIIESESTEQERKSVLYVGEVSFVIVRYEKDHIVENYYNTNEEEAYQTITFDFDANERPCKVTTDRKNRVPEVDEMTYDANGIWTSVTQMINYEQGSKEVYTMTIKTELNDRGDWVKARYYVKDEPQGCIQRKIFYKN